MATANIFMLNTASQTVAATTGVVSLGTVQRRYNACAIDGNTTGITLQEAGYYLVNADITFTAPAAGDISIALQRDGNTIATATETVGTASTEYHTIGITAVVRVTGCGESVVSLVNTGLEATVTNVSVTVTKVR